MQGSASSIRVALDAACLLGEGLHWDVGRGALWFVDIHGRRLLCWDGRSRSAREWALSQRIGWVIPEPWGDSLLVGLQEGIARITPDEGQRPLEWLARPFEGRPQMRLNDAKADGVGAIWTGSLNNDDEARSDGALYRFDPDGRFTLVDSGYTVANGPAISPDGATMLHTDSGRRTIYAFDLDQAAGKITNKRIWKRFEANEGYPDGMCFDADGCVWVAHWGGGCVSRFQADGRLLTRVELPASLITNVCFGGERFERLFVSSARAGLSSDRLSKEPAAGSLFEIIDPGTHGFSSGGRRKSC
jgi:xylono-1,5-lactonase